MTTTYVNNDLLPLIYQAMDAFKAEDLVTCSALRAKINTKLRNRGQDPLQFWTDFKNLAERYYHTSAA